MAVLVLYGSNVADATLTTACDMASTTGGVEASLVTTNNAVAGTFMEVTSKGLSSVPCRASIPAPTGNGWIFYPGAGTFAADNWAPIITMACSIASAGASTWRAYLYSGGIYTAIGTINFTPSSSAKTTYTLTATSMPAVTTGASDGIYFDLWYQDNSGVAGDTATIYESTSATTGVANDMQVTTSVFTPQVATPLVKPLYVPFGIPRAFGATIMPTVIKPPLIYTPRALGGTILTDSRIFIPRAFGGVYIPDDPTLLWVPRAFGGTTQIASGIALAKTIAGV